MVEKFSSRDDRLIYRSATYIQDDHAGGGDFFEDEPRAPQRTKGKDAKRLLPIRKVGGFEERLPRLSHLLPLCYNYGDFVPPQMAEKFLRDPSVDADLDIDKRTYFLQVECGDCIILNIGGLQCFGN